MKNDARKFSIQQNTCSVIDEADQYRNDLLSMIERLGSTVAEQRDRLAQLHSDVEFTGRHRPGKSQARSVTKGRPRLTLVK